MFCGMTFFSPLRALEVFNVNSSSSYKDFDYAIVSTVSFVFFGAKEIDVNSLVKSVGGEKAEVVITGKSGLEVKTLFCDVNVHTSIYRNNVEKSVLVKIDAYVEGVAKTMLNSEGKPYRSNISISSDIFVLTDSIEPKEIELAIAKRLQTLSDKITNARKTKPKFFVVH